MDLQKPLQREIGKHIPVVTEDGLIFLNEILNVFQSACCVKKDRFMAKKDGYASPLPSRKFP
jgi:hypothetical protein